jgi:MoaA/NifB/PqqE/SkfB family radical SAM enzyme
MKKQNSQLEISLACAAANSIEEAVDYLIKLDGLDEQVFGKLGDVGVINMRMEMKIAMYRAARDVAEEYKDDCRESTRCGGCSLTGYCGGCCGDTSEG